MTKPILFRHRVEYVGFLLLASLLRAMPVEAASGFCGFLWRTFAPFIRRHRRSVAQLQAAYPEKSAAECDALARDMWEGLGRVFAEALHMDDIAAQGRVTADVDVERLPADRSFVVAAAHQGNWEIAASALPQVGGVGAGVYQTLKNPLVDAYVYALRSPAYPGGLWPKRGAAAREALKHLRGGGVFLTLADLRDAHGVGVPFFGRLAPTSTFPALAARVSGKPLFAAQIVREPGVRFRVKLREIPVPRTDDREADILAATTALHAAFEASIRERPAQWMWVHRRWG